MTPTSNGKTTAAQLFRSLTDVDTVDAHRIIENKIAHHLECIRELKSELNELAPILIIPPEILATTFYLASVGRTQTTPFFPCYYFTHVSRSWRSVALDTPNLWQVLPRDTRWADVVLERSKGADLVVREDFPISPHYGPRIMFLKGVLANHTSRIRELCLTGLDIPTLDTLVENLPQSSLQLQSLELSSSESLPRNQPTFPIGILETGILQSLVVHRCIIGPWYSLSFPSLTRLTLRDILDRPLLIEFLEMLRGFPTLHVLVMGDSLPLANDLVGRVATVHLPNLQVLSLSSTTSPKEVTNLLPFIIIPPTATFRLTPGLTTPEEAEPICHDLASSFSSFFQVTGSPYSRLRVMQQDRLLLCAWKNGITPDLVLGLGASIWLDFASDLLQQIIHPLNIASLTVEVPSLPLDTFGHLPGLRDITIFGKCTTDLVQALSCKPESVMPFPALQTLSIRYRFFEEGKKRSAIVEDLQGCLLERCERNAGLSKLKLSLCGLRSDEVARLRNVVNKVEWDEA